MGAWDKVVVGSKSEAIPSMMSMLLFGIGSKGSAWTPNLGCG